MSQAHFDNFAKQSRTYFLIHDKFPTGWIPVGIDVYYAIQDWARHERRSFNSVTIDVAGHKRAGIQVHGYYLIPFASMHPNAVGLMDTLPIS